MYGVPSEAFKKDPPAALFSDRPLFHLDKTASQTRLFVVTMNKHATREEKRTPTGPIIRIGIQIVDNKMRLDCLKHFF